MSNSYHPVTREITSLLKKHQMWFETFEHEPVRTSEEAAKVRTGYSLQQGAKALIIKAKPSKGGSHPKDGEPLAQSSERKTEGKFVMLVFPADKKFDSKKVKKCLLVKDIRFATEKEVFEITDGVKLGGVPPFGNLFGIEVIADPILFENEKIIFNAGDKRFSVGMRSEDYRKIVNPQIADIIEK